MRTETQPRPELDLVVERDSSRADRRSGPSPAAPRRLNDAGVFLLVATTITVVGLLYLIQTSQVAGLGYDVSTLEARRRDVSLANQALTYQVAGYEALPRIERAARGQLGMQPLGARVYLSVPRPASDELAVPAQAEPSRRSLGARIWDRLTGEADASHPVEASP